MTLLVAVSLGNLTSGTYTPWSPMMDAWSGAPIPNTDVIGRTSSSGEAPSVFQAKQLPQLPFAWGGRRQRGPRSIEWRFRLTQDQLVRRVIQGDGKNIGVRKQLTPAETTALVAFLRRCTATQPARATPSRP